MKPKMLKYPFSWKERKVLIESGVWYVPEYYDKYQEFTFPGWTELFGNGRPVCIEYCSGNGTWLAEKARQFPDYNWLGVEKQFERARKIWSKMKNMSLSNLAILCGEGYTATQFYFPRASVEQVFINFPDPWPKKRHEKHRLIRPEFVNELHRILCQGGIATLVTDDPDYSNLMISEMMKHKGFESCYPSPYYTAELAGYGSSFFEELWRGKGKTIRYHQFRKEL